MANIETGIQVSSRMQQESLKLKSAMMSASGRYDGLDIARMTFVGDERTARALIFAESLVHFISRRYITSMVSETGLARESREAQQQKRKIRNPGLLYVNALWDVFFPDDQNARTRLFDTVSCRSGMLQLVREFYRNAIPVVYGCGGSAESILLKPLVEIITEFMDDLETPSILRYSISKDLAEEELSGYIANMKMSRKGKGPMAKSAFVTNPVPALIEEFALMAIPAIDDLPSGVRDIKDFGAVIKAGTAVRAANTLFIAKEDFILDGGVFTFDSIQAI